MFNTEIGNMYNLSIIPTIIIAGVVIYMIKKNGNKVKKLIDNQIHEDIDEIKKTIEELKDDISYLMDK